MNEIEQVALLPDVRKIFHSPLMNPFSPDMQSVQDVKNGGLRGAIRSCFQGI
jgi:hypothetical protein